MSISLGVLGNLDILLKHFGLFEYVSQDLATLLLYQIFAMCLPDLQQNFYILLNEVAPYLCNSKSELIIGVTNENYRYTPDAADAIVKIV